MKQISSAKTCPILLQKAEGQQGLPPLVIVGAVQLNQGCSKGRHHTFTMLFQPKVFRIGVAAHLRQNNIKSQSHKIVIFVK